METFRRRLDDIQSLDFSSEMRLWIYRMRSRAHRLERTAISRERPSVKPGWARLMFWKKIDMEALIFKQRVLHAEPAFSSTRYFYKVSKKPTLDVIIEEDEDEEEKVEKMEVMIFKWRVLHAEPAFSFTEYFPKVSKKPALDVIIEDKEETEEIEEAPTETKNVKSRRWFRMNIRSNKKDGKRPSRFLSFFCGCATRK